ncbi:MAG TPA: hypothetical protein PK683_08900 [Leptospiraceae bacterium]|nr:hypothetical protein [Leptospiraceae bacterium]
MNFLLKKQSKRNSRREGMMTLDNIRGSLLGLAAADAAGVPYEFKDRNVGEWIVEAG